MKYITAIIILLVCASAGANSFVEIIGEDSDSYLQVKEQPVVVRETISESMPSFDLEQGLLKTNIERLTSQYMPLYELVWSLDDRLEQYSNVAIVGDSYEDLLEQISRQYIIGACIRPNNVVEMYDIQANRFYCED
ncbi:hypothetical protein HNW13_018080 [Shewanella sp. BF02_Schw]|uniref:hypothetical protein n=1 Tax=Shewanella sp. BF02_Schw TaxID=394908 RepID=UPI001783BDDA|nr:hypothetical protein [Shewanella sp. BF02_Schw]MBO1897649.1 hypothetical protein [Shewanella sp. BF02_Schw]